jgi:translation elongation factor EF-4
VLCCQGLNIIPIINKIDLPAADVEATKEQIIQQFDFKEEEILYVRIGEILMNPDFS